MTPDKPIEDMTMSELLTNQLDQEPFEREEAQPVRPSSSDTE
ncbi:hypothetical protein JOF41_000751 [Saccharothrix coeruleofusca]|nr:hypothetical protein [Saccharothrix coeruleofusca]MBP2334573.1 hypothetical protein [Saccharothrix coeruleofusca]